MPKKFGFGLWMIAKKISMIILMSTIFSSVAIAKEINKANPLPDQIIETNNGIILNKQNSSNFPIESIIIKENKILVKTSNAEYAPVKTNKIGSNYYTMENLFFLHPGGGIILPKGVNEKDIMIYKNGKYKLKLFTDKKGTIKYAVASFERFLKNKKYISTQKFIPSTTLE